MSNQANPKPTVQIAQSEVKKSNHTPIIVILAILAVCGFAFGGFELYDNLQSKNQAGNSENKYSNNNENSNEGDDKRAGVVISENASFSVPNPLFRNGENNGTVKFEYGIYNDILFAYSIKNSFDPYGNIESEIISNNVDINTGKKLSNTKVLKRVNITIEEVYRRILENLTDTVSIGFFSLNTQGDVSGETISVNDFKNNINKYVEQLKDSQDDVFYILLKDSKITVSYEQNKTLEKLGMSSHMGAGLVSGYIDVELQK